MDTDLIGTEAREALKCVQWTFGGPVGPKQIGRVIDVNDCTGLYLSRTLGSGPWFGSQEWYDANDGTSGPLRTALLDACGLQEVEG